MLKKKNRLGAEMTKGTADWAAQWKCHLYKPDGEESDHRCMREDRRDPNYKPLNCNPSLQALHLISTTVKASFRHILSDTNA